MALRLIVNLHRSAKLFPDASSGLPVSSGLLFANPIPEEYSIAKADMDGIIAQALHDAEQSGSIGSDNTPFVLNRIREITNGNSVKANRLLVEANVTRGTRIAVHLANLGYREMDW